MPSMLDFSARAKAVLVAASLFAFSMHASLLASTSHVAGDKPQIFIEQKYVEISVNVVAGIKPLFANCLAEGTRWANKTFADAQAEWRDNRKAFRGQRWFYGRYYFLRSAVGRYVSVERSDEWFDGGAHPNQNLDTILWDDVARKRINVRGFFAESADNGPTMTALAQLAKLAVASAKLDNGINGYGDDDGPPAEQMTPEQELQRDTFITNGIKPAILEIGPVTLAPSTEAGKSSGLTFHYSPYGVGPYVEGPYIVFVPWTKFQQYLSPQGAALFGGERPQDDKERW
jgi:hypothetical protein